MRSKQHTFTRIIPILAGSIAIQGFAWFCASHGQSPSSVAQVIDTNPPPKMLFAGGVSGLWLTVGRANLKATDAKGYDPSYTYVLSDFEPRIQKLKDGKWLIQFECNICKDLP